jgi:FtsP/CotA-like multicopper oxidase with cupredoxin domain
MSRNQRIGLLVAAAVVVVVAIVVAVASGGDDGSGADTNAQTTTQTTAETSTTRTSTEEPHETVPAEPKVNRIQIKGGQPVGGVQDIKVKKGDRVTIVVSADAEDDIHLHGYDIEKPVEPGKPATFKFTADIEGIFEIESHVAEDAGREPLMGKLTVEPD